MKFFTEQQLTACASQYMRMRRFRVFALYGDLGSGKSTFVRACAQTLDITRLASPTFTLMQVYSIHDQSFHTLCHVDAWRIQQPKELIDIGFLEYRDDLQTLCFIEWADRVSSLLPKKRLDMFFSILSPSLRTLQIYERA
ncbi:MAG: tRNA (adenosine(37)-N6)-threonylcarbamoyltransferase complex ATPase subunit type 1 TsaE [Candidatus Kerfeldbacteria bacterium RIFCSPHIGHO2_02_FULL_42_14]|uniref:tRNA threonylcarbamoyladenosine biosynthesis protein TsaE n=1 Tax=Candidatus Kerfeldbacteria bacterium RIFCSPHIGHO2_02_FULL_42_14 TaxID=1798540 RepID=A0A1G2AQ73_9BACT|nr:MAG: tRNA (adenosine(37)-N6)-threonylcarbamoyltransferase complex ATPase subunit type 1 TsaE [Candidatus Kerfeldbacteria bacterium RIFCSPHIGHO2_02_FULL_42_14]OGY80940.1 MAG: tRNA (adenosine(37)-N6)-threonylcarbamoyltransferase complex ATPase subunit type 1 TsaE [Candidatus Kerfeldbacteria bacterium RIFCSPHIGHO2_12_FULL_42_13]OGY84174.1 MAG: tRNA (adenosine(37)-N6)-threonylcarbamoyltransferase complex ATPase subunit type 1 TsaE [Candidatus Kerfeldbacteria bacterium RIFCSPLOWO2_02_FULL_42_19]OG